MRRPILLLALALAGCAKTADTAPTTVRGRVFVQGRPLAGGTIVFAPHPERGGAGKPVSADIDAEGAYELKVEKGVPAGWYRVAIADPPYWTVVVPGDAPKLAAVSGFPEALRRPDRSGLEREVLVGRENEFEFHIEVKQ